MGIRTKEFYEFQNRVMEKLEKTNLSQNESKYCWTLFRESFGRGEVNVKIKGSEMAEKTGLYEANVSDIQKRLKSRKIIQINGKIKGFNLNTDEWENLQAPVSFKNLQAPVRKSYRHQEEKVTGTSNSSLIKKEKNSLKKGFYKKLSRKEIDKLEGKPWLRATMIELENLPKNSTDRFLEMADFTGCYNAWLALQDAYGVRDKIAWLIAKVKSDPNPEE
ncbi:unnamed protein product [marine sediment metagenome]|uniref:Bacteriophage lambda Replication protein O N-terminal domain-containing protein n=1 Tax=marine sediment metagenome TaxID=412755 RepID=X1PX85_9ZZZZ